MGRPLHASRFARRLLAVFVVCTVLPLALSDALATFALAELAESLESRQQMRTTRQIALQVYDRLLAARATLLVLPPEGGASSDARAIPPGAMPMFKAIARPQSGEAHAAALALAWRDAGDGGARPETGRRGHRPEVTLRLDAGAPGAPRILLARGDPTAPGWIAELDPSHVFAPLAESGSTVGDAWQVADADGRTLAAAGGALDTGVPAAGARAAHEHRTALFLGSDFGTADWTFRSSRQPLELDRHGVPLGAWLALVAAAAALASLWLGTRFLRRLLGPLRRLTEGTRALAAGDASARVPVAGDDEIGELGGAFNEMADRIDTQIRSLELLAAIDRDVLVGAPLDAVARRVVDGVAALHRDASVGVAWRTGQRKGDWRGWLRAGGRGVAIERLPAPVAAIALAVRTTSAAADVAPPTAVVAGGPMPAPASDAPSHAAEALARAAAADAFAGVENVRALRIGPAERTDGWLVVGGAHEPALDRLLGELRDRLSVAFAARERDTEMAWQASHDGLTGLANRTGLVARIDALAAATPAEPFALLFVDLDRFKDANDSFGHEAGDRLLQEAAARLAVAARAFGGDAAQVARQGGDEFVIVLPVASAAEHLAADVVARLAEPFRLGVEEHTFGASVGVVVFPAHGRSCDELLRRADTAMYAAKAEGRGRFRVFEPALEEAAHQRLAIPAALRRALDRGELAAWFQPRVDARDGRPIGAEALVRWHHPEHGLVPPHEFIGVAEESSLIEDIGRLMLDAACAQVAGWRREGLDVGRISVNVSARQLASGRLADDVAAALGHHDLGHDALELEVTESILVDDLAGARSQLDALRRLGTTVALDDFGSGYSSLSMLRGLPVDVMKIDRAFVVDLGRDEGAFAVARAIAALARAFGLRLVAEGVETDAQALILASLGCDELQGFRYARPMPAAELGPWLAARLPVARPLEAL